MSELAKALAAVQAEMPKVAKTNTARVDGKEGKAGFTYHYADLADVSAALLPVLSKHGLSFSSKPTVDDGKFVLAYTLRHISGESDSGVYPLVGGTPQQIGSAITYARRYSLCAITGLAPAGDDDDAQQAQQSRVDEWEAARPVFWDPVEQAAEKDGWEAEIAAAKTPGELEDIAKRLRAAKGKRLSPATFDHLWQAGAVRLADLKKEASSEQAATGPVDPPTGGVGEAPESGSSQPAQSARRSR